MNTRVRTLIVLIAPTLGVGLSLYATHHHVAVLALGQSEALCNISAAISCDRVAMSPYSELLGVPLGVFGLAFFLSCLFLGLLSPNNPTLKPSLTAMASVGLLVSLVLAGLSLFAVGSLCLVCLGIYLCTLAIFASTWPNRDWKRINIKSLLLPIALTIVLAILYFPLKQLRIDALIKSSNSTSNDTPRRILDIQPKYRKAFDQLADSKSPALGSIHAPVQMILFVDFQCPHCREMDQVIEPLLRDFKNETYLQIKHFPIDGDCNQSPTLHPSACIAAKYGICAHQFGKYWEYQKWAFSNQKKLSKHWLEKNAAPFLEVPARKLENCVQAEDTLNTLKADIALGHQIETRSTPTLLINGGKYSGPRQTAVLNRIVKFLLDPTRVK